MKYYKGEGEHRGTNTFLAGSVVPAGTYRRIGSDTVFELTEEGFLPASLDGRVASYERVKHTWEQHQAAASSRAVVLDRRR